MASRMKIWRVTRQSTAACLLGKENGARTFVTRAATISWAAMIPRIRCVAVSVCVCVCAESVEHDSGFPQAALAYDRAAVELHGNKAKTNFGDNSGGGFARKYSAKRKKMECDDDIVVESPPSATPPQPQFPMMMGSGCVGPSVFPGQSQAMMPLTQSQLCMMLTPQGPVLVQLPVVGMQQGGHIGQQQPMWVAATQPMGSSGMPQPRFMMPPGFMPAPTAPTFVPPPQPTIVPQTSVPPASTPTSMSLPRRDGAPLSEPVSAPLATLCDVALSQPAMTSSAVLTSMNP